MYGFKSYKICHKYNGLNYFYLQEISEAGRNAGGSDPDANIPPSMKPDADGGTSEEFGPRELLCILADAYDKIDVAHGNFQQPLLSIHVIFCYCKLHISGT